MMHSMARWRLLLLICSLAAGFHAAAIAHPYPPRHWPEAVGSAKTSKPSAGGTRSALIRQLPFGISIEYPLLEKALGPGPCPSDALITTFRELGWPALRIGGDSQDLAGPTPAYHYFIPQSFWTVLGCFARETKAQINVGLNFGDGTLADNLAMISSAEQVIPASRLSFSLGNEPDLYGRSHVLHNEPSFRVPAYRRAASWSASAYAREWTDRRAMLGPIRLEGPDLAASGWRAGVARLLREDPPTQINTHFYPATACPLASQATPKLLLSKHASIDLMSQFTWLLSAAKAVHRPAVISETNSASCGGKPGVSDSPVASIWAVRFVEAALLAGFEQVRFHTAGTSYDAFAFNSDGTVTRRPLATALFFIHRWIPVGSRITSTTADPQVFAATITRHGTTSMIVTSFASHSLVLPIAVAGTRRRLTTDTLTTRSAIEIPSSLRVVAHQAQLRLAPNTVVAFRTR
jgi:hypothetical protein